MVAFCSGSIFVFAGKVYDLKRIKVMTSNYVRSISSTGFFFKTIYLVIMLLVFIFLYLPASTLGQNYQLKNAKKLEGDGVVFINGKQSTHQELRDISPSTIECINIINDQSKASRFNVQNQGIIEITLKPNKKSLPLQIMLNNEALSEKSKKTPPLLVFDNFICPDQNPNNITTDEMAWIDVFVGDSAISRYKVRAMNGLILAKFKPIEEWREYESMPEFPGGVVALRNFIKNTMKYPEAASKNKLFGKVYINFLITKTGKVKQVKVARGIHPILDSEAVRIVKLLPDWKPGEQYPRGKIGSIKYAVSYTIPIEFKLP